MSGWLFLYVGERTCGFFFFKIFKYSKYSTAGPSSGSSVHLCRHDLLPHDTITCTTPSMPRLGETPYFPMQAGPKDLRGV